MEKLYWVDINYACFGIVVLDNVVVDAAPIVKWMIGKTFDDAKSWLKNKKARIIQVI